MPASISLPALSRAACRGPFLFPSFRRGWRTIFVVAMAIGVGDRAAASEAPQLVSFDREIRPLLAANCYFCHGPDASTREADLRLDLWETADSDEGSGASTVIVARSSADSELVARLESADPDLRMPPSSSSPPTV